MKKKPGNSFRSVKEWKTVSGLFLNRCYCCYEEIHDNKVAEAASHDKEMKDFMRTEVPMSGIKDRQL